MNEPWQGQGREWQPGLWKIRQRLWSDSFTASEPRDDRTRRCRSLARGGALLLAWVLSACGPAKPDVEVDGWAVARAALVDGQSCYAKRPEYCIREPAFVDAAIQGALDSRFSGQMPKLSREVEKLVRSARGAYRNASESPEQLAAIEALVAAYYANPTVDASSDPRVVNVDLGALPGQLAIEGRTPTIVLRDSPLIEDFRWQSAEAGRVLATHAHAHPDKAVVRVELTIPRGSSPKTLVYRYFREQKRVALGELLEDSIYLSDEIPGGLEAMAAGRLTLDQDSLKLCSRPRSPDEGTSSWCPWSDPYGQAAAKAAEATRRANR